MHILNRTMLVLVAWLLLISYSHASDDMYTVDIAKANMLCQKVCKDRNTDMRKVSNLILKYRGKMNPNVILAIGIVESNLYSKARDRGSRSLGFMQVNVKYHRSKFRSNDYYDIEDNIRVGSIILNDCAKKHKYNHRRTLRCYNGGSSDRYLNKVNKHLHHGVFIIKRGDMKIE